MVREYPSYPIVAVGAVIIRDQRVLLIRRGNDPHRGRWSTPGGAVELGETLAQAAARKVREECQLEVEIQNVLSTFDLIQRDEQGRVRYHYVLIDVAARPVDGEPQAGTDALELRWVTEAGLDKLDIISRLRTVLRQALRRTPGTANPAHH